ncbi:MAG: tripartite tricarboxylate transporter substrate binding protein [Alphaproteobacteria bacterium]|nr:tripartite tricarboxylate transporter substrate binding protein [Alphaproteobacteria bacterium]
MVMIGRLLGAAALALVSLGAFAQAYPNKEITLIVPFNPGGSTDVVGRGFAEAIKPILGQPVAVQNLPGAGTATGFTRLADHKADGHTLAVMGPFMVSTALRGQLKVPLADYTYIARISQETFVLGVPAASPLKSIKDFVAAAKAKAGTIGIGTAGSGTLTHLTAAALGKAIGADLNIVHFSGGGQLTPAVLGGHIDAGVFSQVETLAHVGAEGKLRVLAVFTDSRSAKLPDVPTLKESGISGVPAGPWQGIVAPKGLPADIKSALQGAIAKTVESAAWKAFLDKNGLRPFHAVGAELDAFLKSEIDQTGALLKAIGSSG